MAGGQGPVKIEGETASALASPVPGGSVPAGSGSLKQLLDLEKIEVWTYRGFSSHAGSTRVFGGQVAGQALVAAGRTVPANRRVHSLHAYFLRPGDTGAPLLYTVEPVRDGGSFTTRRVLAIQHGEVVFSLSASFQAAEEGIAHQEPALVGPGPEESPDVETVIAHADPGTQAWYANFRLRVPLDVRLPEGLGRIATVRGETRPPRQRIWVRSGERLPDDPLIHACAVTYVSDLFLLSASLLPHGVVVGDPEVNTASLDHAVWFHAPFRADEWLFYDQESSWAGSGRALCQGMLFDRSGVLVASVMQEGLIRSHRAWPREAQ
jgi:acyl-CoA thioesterase-2